MKTIVLSEGKHDTHFFRELFGDKGGRVKYFNLGETLPTKNLLLKESQVCESFKEDSSPHLVLFKSEAGKDKLKLITRMLRSTVVRLPKMFELIMVIDADGRQCKIEMDTLMDHFLKKGNVGTQYKWTEKVICEHDDFVVFKVDISTVDSPRVIITSSKVVMFKQSLETAAKVTRGDANLKISEYANKQDVQKEMKSAFSINF